MNKKTKYLYVISFDGLSTLDFEYIKTLDNFKSFLNNASYCKEVYSVYPTLTYPAHASIVTGKYPKNHGIINNTLLQPNRERPDWYWQRKYIKGETLYDLAIDSGMTVAALLWPVTAKSRIQYNLPEIFANRPWQNQIMVSLLNGSPIYQYVLNKKFGHLRDGLKQPNLDNFTHQSLLYTIKNKKTDITLAHYTDLDTIRHHYGFYSNEAIEALKRHDIRLGEMIKTIKETGTYEDSTIILLGDHSSLDEDTVINLNVLLKRNKLITVNNKGKITDYKAITKTCDGSCYLYLKDKNNIELINDIKKLIEDFNAETQCIEGIFSQEEAIELGADPACSMMFEAKKGFYFLDNTEGDVIKVITPKDVGTVPDVTLSTHGYSPFKKDYTTVFIASGKGIKKNIEIPKINLIDEAPTLAKLIGVEFKETDGRVLEEILN